MQRSLHVNGVLDCNEIIRSSLKRYFHFSLGTIVTNLGANGAQEIQLAHFYQQKSNGVITAKLAQTDNCCQFLKQLLNRLVLLNLQERGR